MDGKHILLRDSVVGGLLFFLGFAVADANAATVNAASCSQANVQTAITAAGIGDTVYVPAGTCTWAGGVSWNNKNISLLGAGKDATIINCQSCLTITSSSTTSTFSQWRLANMTFQGAAPSGTMMTIWDNNGSWHYGWRIDHMKFNYPGAGAGYGVFIGGPTYGLLDHNEWVWGNGMAVIISSQMSYEYPPTASNPQGGYLDSQPLDMGTANAVYIEDSTFTSTLAGGCAAYDTSSGGGRMVFRYNVLTGCMYYSHWTRSAEIGGILHEIYNNKFVATAAYSAYPIRLEAGTGVIFNNTVTSRDNYAAFDERRGFMDSSSPLGACDGTKSWDGNAGDPAAPGWPCLGQIGRAPGKTLAQIMSGSKQVSSPIYLWNNGPENGCSSGGACSNNFGVGVYDGSARAMAYVKATPHPNGEVDYAFAVKPGYVPFRYPHPLQGTSLPPSPLVPPTNLRVVP